MKIQNEFTVDAPVDEAWALLTDIPAIAPCLPGARLTGVEGETYEGTVTVKVGPMTAKYTGTVEFAGRDDDAHRATLSARGRDARGAGTAEATIVAQLTEADGRTTVAIDTDLVISGKVAQFGRGVIADVSEQLLGQFADCIGGKLRGEEEPAAVGAATGAGAGPASDAGERQRPEGAVATAPPEVDLVGDEPEPFDLVALAGGAIGRRVAIAVAAVAGVLLVVSLVRRLMR